MYPGGSPFNVAVGLARLGQPVAFASKVSTDLFGRYLREYLDGQRIDSRFLLSSATQSTLAFVAMEGGEPSYAFYGEGAADTTLTPDEIPLALLEETGILHFGSISLLRGSTPGAVLSTVQRLKGRALLSFDPNIRSGLVRDEPEYRSLLDSLFALADIVKVSAADLAWLAPGEPPEDVASRLLKRGPAMVIVTRGSRGVLAMTASGRWDVPSFSVAVADTVGAGDAFTSGLLAGFAERGVFSRAELVVFPQRKRYLRYASRLLFPRSTCTRHGADPPTRGEVAGFIESYRDN